MGATRPFRRSTRSLGGLAVGALALVAGLTAPACSEDDEPTDDVPATESSAPPGADNGDDTGDAGSAAPALVDIEDCTNDGGEGTAAGTIENTGDETASWELTIDVLDAATEEELASATTEVTEVAPGDTGDWSVTVSGLGDADVTCETSSISAP
ncbi:MAG: FxLYD domain-containing protein [Acidimicrobiales bacterium]|jgi:hypothetical protein|nr:FxLYD domain-containing protein [Acidimicrobiales bacterium]